MDQKQSNVEYDSSLKAHKVKIDFDGNHHGFYWEKNNSTNEDELVEYMSPIEYQMEMCALGDILF